VAGCQRFPFTRLAVKRVHAHSGGVPRLINVIADRALTAGYVHERILVGERDVDLAAREALATPVQRARPWIAIAAAGLACLALLALWLRTPGTLHGNEDAEPPAVAASPTSESDADDGLLDDNALRALIEGSDGTSYAAWNQLLALWTLRANEADVRSAQRCPPSLSPGVSCLRSAGTLAKLESLRRPVVLRLYSGEREAWAVLLGIGERRVRLWIDGETVETTPERLQRQWLGEFHAIWRTPAFVAGNFRRGDAGAAVEWLIERLQQAGHLSPQDAGSGPAYFDLATEAAVRRLQGAHGLLPDGIAGPETQFAASSHERQGPRLRRLR
jgi:general secretion pathway protein A